VGHKLYSLTHANDFCDMYSVSMFYTEWHQYDGVMMKEPSFISSLTYWLHDTALKQMKMATLAMLPSWDELGNEQEERRAEKLLEKVDQICFCVKNSFLNEDLIKEPRKLAEVKYLACYINCYGYMCN